MPDDTNNWSDIFLRDTVAGTTSRVSLTENGRPGPGHNQAPAISSDGRFVSFPSDTTWCSSVGRSGGLNRIGIHVRDMVTHTTRRGSDARTGGDPDGSS